MGPNFGGSGPARWGSPLRLLCFFCCCFVCFLLCFVTSCLVVYCSVVVAFCSRFFSILVASPMAHAAHCLLLRSYEVVVLFLTHALGRAKPAELVVVVAVVVGVGPSSTNMSITYTLFCLVKCVWTPLAKFSM